MKPTFVFFTDKSSLPGLHVALCTLALNHRFDDANIIIYHYGLRNRDLQDLAATHRGANSCTHLIFKPYTPRPFGSAKPLHGSYMAYGRLYLGQLLEDYNACIYLDCDLIVNDSLLTLLELLDSDTFLAADGLTTRRWSPDWAILSRAGLGEEGRAFNSGVLAINLAAWRKHGILDQLLDAANYYGKEITSDQPLLNIVLADRWKSFGPYFNFQLFPGSTKNRGSEPPAAAVYHLVGSPKPWDLLGQELNSNYALWREAYLKTAVSNRSLYQFWSIRRTIMLAGRYKSEIAKVLKSWFKRLTPPSLSR